MLCSALSGVRRRCSHSYLQPPKHHSLDNAIIDPLLQHPIPCPVHSTVYPFAVRRTKATWSKGRRCTTWQGGRAEQSQVAGLESRGEQHWGSHATNDAANAGTIHTTGGVQAVVQLGRVGWWWRRRRARAGCESGQRNGSPQLLQRYPLGNKKCSASALLCTSLSAFFQRAHRPAGCAILISLLLPATRSLRLLSTEESLLPPSPLRVRVHC